MNIIRDFARRYYRTKYSGEYTDKVRSLQPLQLEVDCHPHTCVGLYIHSRNMSVRIGVHRAGLVFMSGSLCVEPERLHENYWL